MAYSPFIRRTLVPNGGSGTAPISAPKVPTQIDPQSVVPVNRSQDTPGLASQIRGMYDRQQAIAPAPASFNTASIVPVNRADDKPLAPGQPGYGYTTPALHQSNLPVGLDETGRGPPQQVGRDPIAAYNGNVERAAAAAEQYRAAQQALPLASVPAAATTGMTSSGVRERLANNRQTPAQKAAEKAQRDAVVRTTMSKTGIKEEILGDGRRLRYLPNGKVITLPSTEVMKKWAHNNNGRQAMLLDLARRIPWNYARYDTPERRAEVARDGMGDYVNRTDDFDPRTATSLVNPQTEIRADGRRWARTGLLGN